jgi:hypothetical protein
MMLMVYGLSMEEFHLLQLDLQVLQMEVCLAQMDLKVNVLEVPAAQMEIHFHHRRSRCRYRSDQIRQLRVRKPAAIDRLGSQFQRLSWASGGSIFDGGIVSVNRWHSVMINT